MKHEWFDPIPNGPQKLMRAPARECRACGAYQEQATDTAWMRVTARYWSPLVGRCAGKKQDYWRFSVRCHKCDREVASRIWPRHLQTCMSKMHRTLWVKVGTGPAEMVRTSAVRTFDEGTLKLRREHFYLFDWPAEGAKPQQVVCDQIKRIDGRILHYLELV